MYNFAGLLLFLVGLWSLNNLQLSVANFHGASIHADHDQTCFAFATIVRGKVDP